MSAPETNVEKQKKRHYGPLLGMVAIGAAAILVMLTLTYLSDDLDVDDATAPVSQTATPENGS
ncbi:hypothetical protein [Neptunicoccus cionae]|uniref:hypothetical protein n=1 Tax=Neptunicoccus cionae TaxID=2035344 RepID=UPI000C7744CD|nr:hypothetical protein [Amylibacter cionae]PLS20410.1 hypothetical protein C0U40_17410 [Amylibacter cionae]